MSCKGRGREGTGKNEGLAQDGFKSGKRPPLIDTVDLSKRIYECTLGECIQLVNSLGGQMDKSAVPVLIHFYFDYESVRGYEDCEGFDSADLFAAVQEAIVKIGVDGTQLQVIIDAFNSNGGSRSSAVSLLGKLGMDKAVPHLLRALKDDNASVREEAVIALGNFKGKKVVDALCAHMNCETPFSLTEKGLAISSLVSVGSRRAIEPMKAAIRENLWSVPICNALEDGLLKLGVSQSQIDAIYLPRIPQSTISFEETYQKATYNALDEGRLTKELVFKDSALVHSLPNPQGWITINEPELAKELLKTLADKLGKKKPKLNKVTKSVLGVNVADLEESHFVHYADELADEAAKFIQNSNLKDDSQLSELVSRIRYSGDGVRLRYIRREKADASLGDWCGDCTAKGGVNFGNSMSWFPNPAYQILKMYHGKRFLGKVNFTVGKLAGEDAVIVDGIEFNPQAKEGKPYHSMGLECLNECIDFLRALAQTQNRTLFVYTMSNSTGAASELEAHPLAEKLREDYGGGDDYETNLQLLIPVADIEMVYASLGFSGKIGLFYQILNTVVSADQSASNDLLNENLPNLEAQVINPAQIAHSDVAAAMSRRDFVKASEAIFAIPEYEQKVKELYGLPQEYDVSPKFLSSRIQSLFRNTGLEIDMMTRYFVIKKDNILRFE